MKSSTFNPVATYVARSGGGSTEFSTSDRPAVFSALPFAPVLTVCGRCGQSALTVTPAEGRAWYRDHDCEQAA